MTKKGALPRRALVAKFSGTPPIRKPGSRPACSSIHARIDEVVVLPWVPATASTQRPFNTSRASHSGPDTYGRPLSSSASTTGMPRVITLPTTTTSGASVSCSAPKPALTSMPSASSCVLIGGYMSRSDPVTRQPAARAMAATPPMKVPPIPRMWTCTRSAARREQREQQQLPGNDLQYHQRDARGARPVERGLHHMAVRGDQPDHQRQAADRDRQLPGAVVLEAPRQPRAGGDRRGNQGAQSKHPDCGLQETLPATDEP